MMTEYDRKKAIFKWKEQLKEEFCILNKLLTHKFRSLDPIVYVFVQQQLMCSFDDLMAQLENYLGVEKKAFVMGQNEQILKFLATRETYKRITKFKAALNTIDEIVSEKMSADTVLEQVLERLKSIFCTILNSLIGSGFVAQTVEGCHITATDPSGYRKPFSPFSKRTQISRFFLERLQVELTLDSPAASTDLTPLNSGLVA